MSKQAYVKAYPKEFWEKLVKLMQVGDRSPREVAEEFGISEDSLRRCVQQAERDRGTRQDGLRSARATRRKSMPISSVSSIAANSTTPLP